MGWDEIDKAKSGGGMFVKLKSGESIEGVFRGEPYCCYEKFKERQEYATYVEGSSLKFKINFIVKENGSYVAKILKQGMTLAKQIRKLTLECGMDTLFKLEREGSGKDDTVYYLIPKGPVAPTSLQHIDAVPLLPLVANKESHEDDLSFPSVDADGF